MTSLIDLLSYGQSYWLDNLTREKILEGELTNRVKVQGLRGITSNPSIFNKAISKSNSYDDQITSLVMQQKSLQEIYDALTIKDVQDACDILKDVYDQSQGIDGFVSLEVSPYLSRDTQGTINKARDLFKKVGRQNCLIKVPGTEEGIPAIEQLLYEGIPVNVTLIFSVKRYEQVARAYMNAIQKRINDGLTSPVISVASVFLSRIDVLTDQLLSQRSLSTKEHPIENVPERLQGKAGVATARLVYQRFKQLFGSAEWKKLEEAGAQIQRPLWASTSNKDLLSGDLRYVEPIIGKNTVTTLPDETIEVLSKQDNIKPDTLENEKEETINLFSDLEKTGINIEAIAQQLENEGIQKFTEAYDELIGNLAKKRLKILGAEASTQTIFAGKFQKQLTAAYASIENRQVSHLLFAQDPYLWKKEGKQLEEISHRLGWISLPEKFEENTLSLREFAETIRQEGYKHVVLLGMGGSSLCSEVALQTYGSAKGYPELLVLDNTSPEAIKALEHQIKLDKTLFIVASKSGNTEETLSFFRYFYDEFVKKNTENPGNHFIAITDDGTPLVKLAEDYRFRRTFLNSPDLGGRYSVLSDFGLVPMALIGIDCDAFLNSARQMKISCEGVPAELNPGIALGAALGIFQKNGRDKVTFVLSSSIQSFGYWVEQLLAESTGKEGKGLIPVNGETLSDPDAYGDDRVFVHLYLKSDETQAEFEQLKRLKDAGHPVIKIEVANALALGGEYYRWEIATSVCGLVMGINPFDQPNVEESKKNTSDLLKGWKKDHSFKSSASLLKDNGMTVYAGKKIQHLFRHNVGSLEELLTELNTLLNPGDYVATLPYFQLTDKRTRVLQNWREKLRNDLKVATTLLGGPRYLHSTGQLHKGGPDSGLYIILVADEPMSLSIPGETFGFDVLHTAQALGDFLSLDDKERRVLRIHLGKSADEGLEALQNCFKHTTIQHLEEK